MKHQPNSEVKDAIVSDSGHVLAFTEVPKGLARVHFGVMQADGRFKTTHGTFLVHPRKVNPSADDSEAKFLYQHTEACEKCDGLQPRMFDVYCDLRERGHDLMHPELA